MLVLFVVFALGATYVPGGTNTEAILTPPLALLPLATYVVYLFVHQQDASEYVAADFLDIDRNRELLTLAVALVVIAVGAEGLVRAARNDDSVTSLTNVLGSNTFNLLVAIPVGVLLSGSATINFLAAIPTMGFLAFATLVFVAFARTDLELTDREAYGFFGLYAVFLVWMTLESAGVIETVRGI